MNALSAITSTGSSHRASHDKPLSPAAPAAAPVPAAALTLSAAAQKALAATRPQPNNIIWGSGPSH